MPSWSSNPNGTMSAAVLTKPGEGPEEECFTYVNDYPRPSLPSSDWILCRIRAAGLNRAELRGRRGHAPLLPEFGIWHDEYHADPPKILGEEFVGEVAEAGSTSGFRSGEKVTGLIYGGGKAYDGAYAQYTLVHKRRLFHLPQGTKLGWDVLGSIPMSLWTAYGSVFLSAQMGQDATGKSILIHGATSSVGIFAILLAKERGATVIATTRQQDKLAHLKRCGTDYAILEDQIENEIETHFKDGVNIIFELVGPDQIKRDLALLARYGTLVISGVLNLEWQAIGFNPMMIPTTRKLTKHTMTDLGRGNEDADLELVEPTIAHVIENIESGKWPRDLFLDSVFKLEEVGAAHAYMEASKAKGKVVLLVS